MKLVYLMLVAEVINNTPGGPDLFQIIGAIGGLLGIAALLTLPWTIKKLSAETRSIQLTTESSVSDKALKHLETALNEADKAIQRIKDEAQQKINGLEEQVDNLETQVSKLQQALEAERAKSEQERELYERRVLQLLYDLHSKDLEIANLKRRGPHELPKTP